MLDKAGFLVRPCSCVLDHLVTVCDRLFEVFTDLVESSAARRAQLVLVIGKATINPATTNFYATAELVQIAMALMSHVTDRCQDHPELVHADSHGDCTFSRQLVAVRIKARRNPAPAHGDRGAMVLDFKSAVIQHHFGDTVLRMCGRY